MKFLCEHCKAKYQIADEKVVGRTVRMKCRKCGGAIEVQAAVTESSVSTKAADVAGSGRPTPPTRPPPRTAPLATSLGAAARTAPPPKPDSALAGAFQRNVQRPANGDDAATSSAGFDLRELSAADEWYVAVNGVPVGPVRVGEVRRKAAMGAVTEDSLCWQEGMEEWRPVRSVTELAAVVREAASGGRSSQLPPEPRPAAPPRPGARATGQHAALTPPREPPKAPAAPAWATKAGAAGLEAPRPLDAEEEGAPTLVGRSPLLELESAALASLRSNGTAPDPFKPTDPFRVPVPGPDPFKASGDPLKPVDPFFVGAASPTGALAAVAAPAPALAPAHPASARPSVTPAPARGMSPIGIGVIVMFACFGITAAYFVLGKPKAPVAVAAPPPTAPMPAGPTPTDLPAVPPPVASSTATAAPTTVDAGGGKVASATPRSGGGAAGAASKPTGNGATDPALRDLIAQTGNGPAAGPGGGGGGGGPKMDEDTIKSVVGQHNLGIRRTCWDRSASTTASVNVTVHIVISGSGQVTQANATGNDPVVGHCLEEEIKRWHWPGGGEVNVPFHFLRQ